MVFQERRGQGRGVGLSSFYLQVLAEKVEIEYFPYRVFMPQWLFFASFSRNSKNRYGILTRMTLKALLKFLRTFSIVTGLVLIWRGLWYVLDWIDLTYFANQHVWTAVGGIVLGLLILYIPDHDLKEIEKL